MLGVNSGVLSAFAVLLDVALAAVWLILAPRQTANVSALPVLLLVACACAWGLFVTPASVAPEAAALEIAKLLGGSALLICGALAGARRIRSKLFCGVLAAVGGAYAIVSFWLYELDPFRVLGVVKVAHAWRFTGTLLNANAAGVVFGMVSLASLGWFLSSLEQRRAAAARPMLISTGLAAAAAALIACGYTGSRMAFSTTVLLSLLLILLEVIGAGARGGGFRGLRLIALAGGMALVFLAVGLGVGKVLNRQEDVVDTFRGRVEVLGHFMALAVQRPLTGWGLGTFDQVNQAHLQAASANYMYAFGAAHSSIIQMVLDGGAPFALLLTAAGALIVLTIVMNWRSIAEGWSRGLGAAVILAAICSVDDIDLNVPAVTGLTLLALGVLWGRAVAMRQRSMQVAAQ